MGWRAGEATLKDYVVQAGPLRTFDALFDPRFDKIRQVADYHTIEINGKRGTARRIIADLQRSAEREIRFVSVFFAAVARGHRTVFGLRDVNRGKAARLALKLSGQDRLRWAEMKYGLSEDDLVLVELRDFAGDFALLREFVPPTEGEMFFYLTSAPLEVYQVYWERAAQASLRPRTADASRGGEARFRREVAAFAHQAKVALHQDSSGSYTVVIHPHVKDFAEVEGHIRAAGAQAGMTITFAPNLFG